MPDARPVDERDAELIRAALAGVTAAHERLERVVADALLRGASVRAVAELGISPNTVQKYGRAHGWPTDANRSRFNETRCHRLGREAEEGGSGAGRLPPADAPPAGA